MEIQKRKRKGNRREHTRKFHNSCQRSTHFIGHHGCHSRVEQGWSDCYDADTVSSEVAGEREGERADCAFGGRVGYFGVVRDTVIQDGSDGR
jgi:hypothetical protein